MPDIVAVLRASIGDFSAKMGAARDEMDRTEKSGNSSFSKLSTLAGGALLGLAAGATAFGVEAVKMGMAGEQTQAQLSNAFHNAGTSLGAYQGQVDAVDQRMTALGFSNDTTNAALARLITVTGNAKGSLNDMGLAADIARARHIDLSSATDLLAKTMAGNLTAAKRMGIEIPPEIAKIKDPTTKANDILAILEGRFQGSASAAAGTFAGKVATMKAEVQNLTEKLGEKLIPIIEKVVSWVSRMVDWFSHHKDALVAVGIAIGAVTVALMAFSVAATIAAAAEAGVLAPVLLIVAGLAILGFAIYELATHWKEVWTDIKNWVNDAWQFIKPVWDKIYEYFVGPLIDGVKIWIGIFKQAFMDAKNWVNDAWNNVIKPVWDFIYQYIIGPLSLSIQGWIIIFKQVWKDASDAVKWAWDNVIKPTWDIIKSGLGDIGTVIGILVYVWTTAWNAIGSAIKWVWDNVIKPVVDVIKGAINDVKGAISFFTGGGGSTPDANPSAGAAASGATPHRAAGGPVLAGQPYMVGEHGPELFTPALAGGITPNNAVSAAPGPVAITLNINGQAFATGLFPDLLTTLLTNKRQLVNLNLS